MRTEDDLKKPPEVRLQVLTPECVLTAFVPTFTSSTALSTPHVSCVACGLPGGGHEPLHEPVVCALALFVATDRYCRRE